MGCVSTGGEQDAGTRYPTVMQDSNGNQVLIRYLAGTNLAWDNSSARISQVEDVRADSPGSASYSFTFNSDSIPHLTRIQFNMGLSTHYHFYYLANQNLNSPFSPPISFGTTHLLSSLRVDSVSLTHQFSYDSGGSGELTKVTFPYGAWFRWAYQDTAYSGSRTQRSVQNRFLAKSAGASETTYAFTAGTPGDTVRPYTYLDDPSGNGQKAWFFLTSGSPWQIGLQSSYEERPGPGQTSRRKQEYTWTQDSASNPYIASVLTTQDEGAAYQKQSKTEQTLDIHGNVTQSKLYGYGSLTTPIRTYTNTYLGGSNYTSRFIFNRLLTSTVSDGANQLTLVTNTYDDYGYGGLTDREGLGEHVSGMYTTEYIYRGNVTQRVSSGLTTNIAYDITGEVTGSDDGLGHSVSIAPAEGTNNAVPGVVTPNSQSNLAESLTYTSFLGVASDTGPNSATTTTLYDADARPTSTTSPHGATTYFTYTNSPPTTTATTYSHWTKTTTDGLGRTIKVETGYDTTTVSTVDTVYDSCACSPLGKIKQVSLPYAPGGTQYWVTYAYDCLGRMLSVTQPGASGSSGTTAYVYEGNTVKVTDPAGKWKKYTLDALGSLVQVTEPAPEGGTHETYYTYNLRGQLTQVSMPRSGTTQTRTFNYDLATGRLASATNPENGTVSYTYNADGSLASKTDAANHQVQYTYDTLGRVTQIRRYPVAGGSEDICQQSNFTYDEGANGWGRLTTASWGLLFVWPQCSGSQSYLYTPGGLVTRKSQNVNWHLGEIYYTWDDEGRMVSVHYPGNGPTFTYTYDSLGRPIKLTDNQATPVDWAKDVTYNAAGQITQMKYTQDTAGSSYYTETRQYNVLQQMTRITVPGVLDKEYRFSATQNNGQITQRKDWVSGEEINYQYDSLNRLISAATTGPQWGQSFTYDGFGNLLAQTVTKGSAPTLSLNVNPATNRITTGGYGYDGNGNLTSMPMLTMTYDVENRLAQATDSSNGTETYNYDTGNQRVWKSQGIDGTVYYYGIDGNLLGAGGYFGDGYYNVYFAGKLIWAGASQWLQPGPVVEDRLGSTVSHFPYGEEASTTGQDRVKFATYYRDSTTALDYARNRYYARTIARFTTPDPSEPGDPSDPQSFNLYAYVQNDPVNLNDPAGLDAYSWGDYFMPYPTTSGSFTLPFGLSISFTTYGGPSIIGFSPIILISVPPTTKPKMTLSNNAAIDKVRRQIYDSDSDPIFRPEILDCMAGLETGHTWNPNLDSKSGTYKGLYQFSFGLWTQIQPHYPYSAANLHNPVISTQMAVRGLYWKLAAVVGPVNYAQILINKQVARPDLVRAISAWESTKAGTQYGSAVLDCADDMIKGDFTAANKHIQWFLDFRHAHPLP